MPPRSTTVICGPRFRPPEPRFGPNDLLIAAHALSAGLSLVTNNVTEFERVPGLKVENWFSELTGTDVASPGPSPGFSSG